MDDLISRQAAIDAVGVNTWAGARIMQLPPAQPEKRTNKRTKNARIVPNNKHKKGKSYEKRLGRH